MKGGPMASSSFYFASHARTFKSRNLTSTRRLPLSSSLPLPSSITESEGNFIPAVTVVDPIIDPIMDVSRDMVIELESFSVDIPKKIEFIDITETIDESEQDSSLHEISLQPSSTKLLPNDLKHRSCRFCQLFLSN